MTSVKMIGYRPEIASAFTALNLEWIEKYFVAEKLDKEILGNPGKYIIDRGGYIYFATVQETIAGTFALLKQDEGTFELGKMAVAGSFQGKKIGSHMLQFCIEEARKLKIGKLILFSNTLLEPAIHLYRKFGFIEVPLGDAEYTRSNIKMELTLS